MARRVKALRNGGGSAAGGDASLYAVGPDAVGPDDVSPDDGGPGGGGHGRAAAEIAAPSTSPAGDAAFSGDGGSSGDSSEEETDSVLDYGDGSPELVSDLVPVVPAADDPARAPTGSVVPYDPLSAYLREIARFPHLSRDEERRLAVKYRGDGDLEAAYGLVSSNLWLVVKIAREYERAARSLLDLIQEGNIGLLEAVRNFDPHRDVRLPSYAAWWIKAYIIRYVIANWRLVKIGTTQAQRKLFFNLKKERDRLEREGFYPGPKLIASNLNVRESDVIEMEQRLSGPDVSVDAPVSSAEGAESTLLQLLPGDSPNAEEVLAEKQRAALVRETLDSFGTTLNDKERAVLDERLLAEEKATLHDLSQKLGISKERVRQIENKVKDKLKAYAAGRLGEDAE